MIRNCSKIIKNYGFKINSKNHVFDSNGNEICNFVPIVLGQYMIGDGRDRRTVIVLMGISEDGNQLETINIDVSDIEHLKWVKNSWGFQYKVHSKMKNQFLYLIEVLVINGTTKKLSSQIGWVKDNGKYAYLHTRGVIGESDKEVDIGDNLSNYFLPSEIVDINRACKASLNLLEVADYEVTVPLLALVYLSPLLQAIKDVGKMPEFVVWLFGTTCSRKTSLARVFLSHFGDFTNRLPATFNDTYASIEIKANAIKDSLNLIDDYTPKQTKKQKDAQDEIAEKAIRAYGDRIARGRVNSSIISQKQYIPQGMLLMTGENLIRGHLTVARLVALELDKDSVNLKLLKEMQDSVSLLGESMRGYIEWLLHGMNKDSSDIGGILIHNFDLYKEELEKIEYTHTKGGHGRSIESCAWLLVGISSMLSYFEDKKVISEVEFNQYIQFAKDTMVNVLIKNNNITKESSPIDEFLYTIKEAIDSNSIKISTLVDGNKLNDNDDDTYGYKDDKYFYFHPDKTYSYVQEIQSKSGNYISLTKRGLIKLLREHSIIKVDSDGSP
ncbi:hypothetical protein QYP14_05790 [Clostridioides difficile]|uniref:hypothetical protein n=1 Tax=Clostridioides difficile TaxID=1496 RepID=UPI0018E92953|nr:hypothetical protein [Clostridioides difficile]MDN4807951.1 hypothetical protein [Clostridioides difficile]HBH1342744.1 hypothetical protein [Clostridioides difficile]